MIAILFRGQRRAGHIHRRATHAVERHRITRRNTHTALAGQVFMNLVENAIKYTPADSSIEISAVAGGDMVDVTIRDHGPGFNPEETDRLFEKFYRSRRGNVPGAGLGLAICKAIVEAHGGRIAAFNHPSGGAAFRFSLPAQVVPEEQIA